jgi:AraC-like DNA-binding protein
MDQKPWHQIRKIDPSFPFLFDDNIFTNYAFHWHEILEFVYMLKGSICISVEGKTYKAFQGDIAIINPGVIHGFHSAETEVVMSTFQVGMELFDQSLVDLRDENSQRFVFSRKTFINLQDNGDLHRRLEELILSMRQEYNVQKKGYRLAIRAKLYEMALIFLRDVPEQKISPLELAGRKYNHQILERVFSFIHSSFNDPNITLGQAANVAALSKFYFTRYFKKQTGQTFHDYLSQVRIDKAKEYLMETDKLITDISMLCGFSSFNTFNRLFKLYNGVSPSHYRVGKNINKHQTIE